MVVGLLAADRPFSFHRIEVSEVTLNVEITHTVTLVPISDPHYPKGMFRVLFSWADGSAHDGLCVSKEIATLFEAGDVEVKAYVDGFGVGLRS